MTATVRDVAMQAGVSIATVSRVLNSPEIVSIQTKDKVQEAISNLDYRPNLAAASLRRNYCLKQAKSQRTSQVPSSPDPRTSRINTGTRVTNNLRLLRKKNCELKRLIRKLSKELNRWERSIGTQA